MYAQGPFLWKRSHIYAQLVHGTSSSNLVMFLLPLERGGREGEEGEEEERGRRERERGGEGKRRGGEGKRRGRGGEGKRRERGRGGEEEGRGRGGRGEKEKRRESSIIIILTYGTFYTKMGLVDFIL